MSQVATFSFVPGQSARSQRAKHRTNPFSGKIGRRILNLVALALTVTELFNKVWGGRERGGGTEGGGRR